ncbi:MAG: iron-sulfur cluster repair di-iron protein [Bacteroidota bacterium]
MQNIEQETLASIALRNHEFIPVLEKYGLDFCCRGKKTLSEACSEKKLASDIVVKELKDTVAANKRNMPFTEMSAEELISYITIHHHFYVKNSVSTIFSHIEKVATKHGDRYPHMKEVSKLFLEVIEDLLPHMEKEEKNLFPEIKRLAEGITNAWNIDSDSILINMPIQVMETEHDHAGQLLYKIRELTNEYTPPEDACTTHRVCLDELRFFEQDLHQHVHLENNILFPMAKKMAEQKKQNPASL